MNNKENKKSIDTFLDNELKKGRITATEIYEREEFELKRKIDTIFAGIGFALIWMLLIIIYGLFI
ncbi:MAG: hypothetical protein SOZ42_01035 [Candidatus Enterosoma sp.]|nr:hypothetical protein [Candidatus Enterosoma sp.]